MGEQRKRRWFQFRLSTWFVLVAILAWGLSYRPGLPTVDYSSIRLPSVFKFERRWALSGSISCIPKRDSFGLDLVWQRLDEFTTLRIHASPTRLLWPISALGAFLVVKGVWTFIKSRTRPRKSPSDMTAVD